MDAENIAALETLFSSGANGRRIVLRLKDLTLVDRGSVSFCSAAKRAAQAQEFPGIHSANGWKEKKMNA